MNRPFALLVASTTCLLLAACGDQSGGSTNTVTPAESAGPAAGAARDTTVSTSKPSAQPAANPAAQPAAKPAAKPAAATPALPSYWFASNVDTWVGKRWNEIDLFHFMKTKPAGLDQGRRIVVFYSRTCEHCEAMFIEDLATNPGLASMVTAVEVPASKTRLSDPAGWAMPDTQCEQLSLPLGADWIISTPMTLRIEDGVITCAQESDHKECMGLE